MGLDDIPSRQGGQTILGEFWNVFKRVLGEVHAPRTVNGLVQDLAGDLGDEDYRWRDLWLGRKVVFETADKSKRVWAQMDGDLLKIYHSDAGGDNKVVQVGSGGLSGLATGSVGESQIASSAVGKGKTKGFSYVGSQAFSQTINSTAWTQISLASVIPPNVEHILDMKIMTSHNSGTVGGDPNNSTPLGDPGSIAITGTGVFYLRADFLAPGVGGIPAVSFAQVSGTDMNFNAIPFAIPTTAQFVSQIDIYAKRVSGSGSLVFDDGKLLLRTLV